MKLFYFALLAGVAVAAGCRRDAESPAYDLTGTYTTDATLLGAGHPVRLFTAQGEVADAALVGRYLARKKLAPEIFSAADVPVPSNYRLKLTFRGGNQATQVASNFIRTDSSLADVTDRQPGFFYLQGRDSVSVRTSPVASTDLLGQLARNMELAVAGRNCRDSYLPGQYPGSTATTQQCRVRPLSVIGAHGSQLYVPYLSWMVWSKGAIVGYWNLDNFFNPAALRYLTPGDTLLVQERAIALHR